MKDHFLVIKRRLAELDGEMDRLRSENHGLREAGRMLVVYIMTLGSGKLADDDTVERAQRAVQLFCPEFENPDVLGGAVTSTALTAGKREAQ